MSTPLHLAAKLKRSGLMQPTDGLPNRLAEDLIEALELLACFASEVYDESYIEAAKAIVEANAEALALWQEEPKVKHTPSTEEVP
jgi:hypothetical protein